MKKIKLNPCPFCGGKAILDSWHPYHLRNWEKIIKAEVYCDVCVARSSVYDSVSEAVDAWNRRTIDGQKS